MATKQRLELITKLCTSSKKKALLTLYFFPFFRIWKGVFFEHFFPFKK